MAGFFPASQLQVAKAPPSLAPQCGACGLFKTCKSPKMPVSGKGRREILVVAEAPGKDEDDRGIQLVGESGQLLERAMRKAGVDMRKDCWLTNSLICRPPNNRMPTKQEIDYCRPNLLKTIKELDPKVIILLGGSAVRSLIGYLWREEPEGISRWVGWRIPSQKFNTWICPTYHPSFLLHSMREKYGRTGDPVLNRFFQQHLERAVELAGSRPWRQVPDYKQQVQAIYEPSRAAAILRKMITKGGRVAFDYETNMLKPDGREAAIYSCSVCWEGKKTIAYPWQGEAIAATGELIRSPRLQKIASNAKFEERWTLKEFGHGVRNWLYDTMLGGHWLDCRRGITSIKFQAFVHLGQPPWDDHIRPFLRSDGANRKNRIHEIDLPNLLTYNGMDSLLEFKVALVHGKLGGLEL